MSRWNRKQIVLDASLSTGSSDSRFNPLSQHPGDENRRLLEAVWEEEHISVFNQQLRQEWREHASPFALAWLARMALKNRTIIEEGSDFLPLLQTVCDCLRSHSEKEAMAKDFHLIRSALATGQLIVSNEVRFPRSLARACEALGELRLLYYGNPGVEGDECRLWIKSGAEKIPTRRIDVWAANNAA